MDIFACGCVVAELLGDGNALFDFATLTQFRKREIEVDQLICERVPKEFAEFRELVQVMTLRNAEKRWKSERCFEWICSKVPKSFGLLYNLANLISQTAYSDEKVAVIKANISEIHRLCIKPTTQAAMESDLPFTEELNPSVQLCPDRLKQANLLLRP